MNNKTLEEEAAAALDQAKDGSAEDAIQITNENALIVMAQALVGIEKHLFALVYIENTKDPEKSGVTFVPEVFQSIYDGQDPFADVDAIVKAAKEASVLTPDNGA